jgi:voltage-gated potassium channel Kch
MHKVTLGKRLRYRFDNMMARGTGALILWLFAASIALIAIVSAVVVLFGFTAEGGQSLPFSRVFWMAMMRTLDAGTMGGDEGSWAFLFSMFAVTLGGIFIVASLIGVLTSGIAEKLSELRKGRSIVAERDHTVILGWSPQVFSIVSELVIANESRKSGARIAILAEKDKIEMDDEIAARVPDTKNTRVVCRSGNPIDLADLEIVSPHTSRSIIVLAPGEGDPDAHVIKSILAVTNNPNRRKEPYHVVAVIQDPKNLEVARMVGGREAELVLASDLISRIAVQTCRQSGLSVVHTELLDFDGDEIYFQEEPGLVGRSFGEALHAYEDSALIGLRRKDGRILLNPPMDTRIEAGDKVIAIAADDDAIHLSAAGEPAIDEAQIRTPLDAAPAPERTLLLGWNRRAPKILTQLDAYVAAGSTVTIVADDPGLEADIAKAAAGLERLAVDRRFGDTSDRATLDSLDVAGFDHIIVLSCSETLDAQAADARTLVTLLHLRDIADKGGVDLSVVSEMLDMRNRELAEVTRADDFIVSDKLVSLMLSQLSENKELGAVFADLFDPAGSEIYLKPAERYVALGVPVTFHTVVASARRRSEVAIGYRVKALAARAADQYGVRVNPAKSDPVTFAEGDKIIVLAED